MFLGERLFTKVASCIKYSTEFLRTHEVFVLINIWYTWRSFNETWLLNLKHKFYDVFCCKHYAWFYWTLEIMWRCILKIVESYCFYWNREIWENVWIKLFSSKTCTLISLGINMTYDAYQKPYCFKDVIKNSSIKYT